MRAFPPVPIWSPVADQLARILRDGGDRVADGDAAAQGVVLVDARGDVAAACAALAGWAAAPVRLALVDGIDPVTQGRLIAAGATQIAVVAPDGEGLAPALRLARRSLAPADRRAAAMGGAPALDRWIDEALVGGRPVAVIHVAMVRLDLVNAAHGRAAGTALIEAAQRRIAVQIAAVAEEDGIVARGDGTAFVAAIAGPAEDAIVAAARIEEALARPFRLDGASAVLGTRITLASSRPGEPAAALRARAAAMTAEPDRPPDDPLAADLHRALGRGEITVLFQPQATMIGAGAVVGVEALARWQHPTRGCLGAEVLFAAAERAGIGVAVSEHVQRRVIEAVAGWPAALGRLRIALNLTAADLARPGFVDTLLAHIDASGLSRDRLTLEVTETGLMTDLDAASAVLGALRAAGCRTAIDDFGTGYSSLSYLASLPIDTLKLDRTLAQEVTGAERAQVVVRAAIAMAQSLGIDIVAEGVENEAQRAALAAAGCTLYQGFLLAPPLDAAGLAAFMEER